MGDGEDSGEEWAATVSGGAGISSSKQQLGPEANAGSPTSPTQQNVTVATDTV